MLQNHLLRIVCTSIVLLFVFSNVNAQEFRGSITGKVTDPNGAVVPGAAVTIKNVETNVQASATSNGEGSYYFSLLLPGKDQLTQASRL